MKDKVILLVDDDDDFRETVRDILELEDYKVIDVSDGKYALPVLETQDIDLVVTDILMPEVEGVELCFKLKELKPDLKVIGFTGGNRELDKDMVMMVCRVSPFETVLSKPFLMEDLISSVDKALG